MLNTLQIKDVFVKINKTILLEDVNLSLQKGDLNIIIGPNGAGKSTLLKAIVKILDIQKGDILLNNKSFKEQNINEVSSQIAYMAQSNEKSNLNVIDVLELSRRKYSGFILSKTDYILIENIIKEFGLEKFLNKNIDMLSGGERQKVFLAAAIIQEPKVLILDEPISHLDPKNQIEMLDIIKRKTKEENFICITVLHDLQNALHYGNKIIMLKNKKIINFQKSEDINSQMLSSLYDIPCKLFWEDGHPFLFLGHQHSNTKTYQHSHKK